LCGSCVRARRALNSRGLSPGQYKGHGQRRYIKQRCYECKTEGCSIGKIGALKILGQLPTPVRVKYEMLIAPTGVTGLTRDYIDAIQVNR
jgi:hypothetical protein